MRAQLSLKAHSNVSQSAQISFVEFSKGKVIVGRSFTWCSEHLDVVGIPCYVHILSHSDCARLRSDFRYTQEFRADRTWFFNFFRSFSTQRIPRQIQCLSKCGGLAFNCSTQGSLKTRGPRLQLQNSRVSQSAGAAPSITAPGLKGRSKPSVRRGLHGGYRTTLASCAGPNLGPK